MVWQVAVVVLLIFVVAVVLALVHGDVRLWLAARRDPSRSVRATRRLARRSVGAALLLVALVLLAFPPASSLTRAGQMRKLGICLSICGVVVLIAVRDLRVMRGEMRQEMQDLAAKSVQDLRDSLKGAAQERRK
jgi:NO-binding membrane sensor protein with MHYT domain